MSDSTQAPITQAIVDAQLQLAQRRQMAGVTAPLSTDVTEVGRRWWNDVELPSIVDTAVEPVESVAETVTITPGIAAACLRQKERTAPYVLYKLLQAIDVSGRGWLAHDLVRLQVCDEWGVYGRRRLATVLRQGEGVFWNRAKVAGQIRIRLVSRLKLAQTLGVDDPGRTLVEMPRQLLQGRGRGRQAQASASLYAAILAGRGSSAPISRDALNEMSGCTARRQRSYEERAGVQVEPQFCTLGKFSEYSLQRERENGRNAFRLSLGKRGVFVATRIPNAYNPPPTYRLTGKRTIRKLRSGLNDLRLTVSGGIMDRYQRIYFRSGAAVSRVVGVHSCYLNVGPGRWVSMS